MGMITGNIINTDKATNQGLRNVPQIIAYREGFAGGNLVQDHLPCSEVPWHKLGSS